MVGGGVPLWVCPCELGIVFSLCLTGGPAYQRRMIFYFHPKPTYLTKLGPKKCVFPRLSAVLGCLDLSAGGGLFLWSQIYAE